jgi:meromycolic acid enoyl-[acyl-carrier-protein] reductase
MLLDGKRLLITGVFDPRSIAFHIARLAQSEGAEVVLTGFGRGRRITERTAKRLDDPPDVLELDVTVPDDIAAVADELDRRWGGLDGLVHAVAFAPPSCLGGGYLTAPWEDVATAVHVSTYSLTALSAGFVATLLTPDGGVRSFMTGEPIDEMRPVGVAETVEEYARFREGSIEFVEARNERIRQLGL